jgi:hypothetical protein
MGLLVDMGQSAPFFALGEQNASGVPPDELDLCIEYE